MSALLLFGLWCFFRRVEPSVATAHTWAWIWVAIEMYNGVAHLVWAAAARSYNPGLASSPFLLVLAIYLALGLRAEGSRTSDQV